MISLDARRILLPSGTGTGQYREPKETLQEIKLEFIRTASMRNSTINGNNAEEQFLNI